MVWYLFMFQLKLANAHSTHTLSQRNINTKYVRKKERERHTLERKQKNEKQPSWINQKREMSFVCLKIRSAIISSLGPHLQTSIAVVWSTITLKDLCDFSFEKMDWIWWCDSNTWIKYTQRVFFNAVTRSHINKNTAFTLNRRLLSQLIEINFRFYNFFAI